MGTEWVALDSSLQILGEFYGSLFDRNSTSDIDKVNSGMAGLGSLNYKRPITNDINAEFQFKARNIGDNILFPGRIDNIERYREYDISPDSSYSGEKLYESSLEFTYADRNTITGLTGFLSRPGIIDRKRYLGKINWNLYGSLDGFGKIENSFGLRKWEKRRGGLRFNGRKFNPEFAINYEKRDGLNGFQYYEYTSLLPIKVSKSIQSNTNVIWRDEKILEDIWRDKFSSISIQQGLDFISGSKGISGELNGAYYKKKYKDYDGIDTDQKSGWGRLSYNDSKGRGGFSVSERLSSSNERFQAKNYIFVGDGLGEYRFEDGEYINDPDGDYILRIEELGEGLKIAEIGTDLSWTLLPFKLAGINQAQESKMGRLTINSELAFNLKKSNDDLNVDDFIPWKTGDTDNIVNRYGKLDFRVYYYPPAKKQRIKYNAMRSFQNGSPYVNEIKDDNFRSDEISWGFPLGRKLEFLISTKLENKNSSTNGVGYKIKSHKETISIDYKIAESRIIRIGPSYGYASQTDINLSAKIPAIKVGVLQNIKTKGRITFDFIYSRLIVDPSGSYIPYQMAAGKKEGDNFEGVIRADFKISENGKFETSYRYEKFANRNQRQSLNLEFKVLFL
jgi:hypothetical protein